MTGQDFVVKVGNFLVRIGDKKSDGAYDLYKKDLHKISKKYKKKHRKEIAVDRLERFSAMIYKLVIDEQIDFDLVVSPGNSGLMMAEITKMIYSHIKKEVPEIHVVPVYRDGNDNDISLKIKTKKVSSVLFVDDEMMTGTSMKHCILSLLPQSHSSHIDIVAVTENMFFEWHNRIPGVSVYFYPYARSVSGMGNNISFIINRNDFNSISKIVPVIGEEKQVMALLLSGKVKDKNNDGEWYFDETVETKVVRRLNDYPSIKRHLIDEIDIFIKSGIQKYKDKEIGFSVK